MLRDLSRLTTKLLILVAVLCAADRLLGSALSAAYTRQRSGDLYRTSYIVNRLAAECVVLGASRARHHYQPEPFERVTHLSFYNAGQDGMFVFNTYVLLSAMLERYSPRIIIWDINEKDILYKQDCYDRLSMLLPYYGQVPAAQEVIRLAGVAGRVKAASLTYRYNGMLLGMMQGLLVREGDRDRALRGFEPIEEEGTTTVPPATPEVYGPPDPNKVKVFAEILELCRSRNVRVVVVNSPVFRDRSTNPALRMIQNITQKEQVPFFDLARDATFRSHPEWFSDASHLNQHGAAVFSERLADMIAPYVGGGASSPPPNMPLRLTGRVR